MSYLARPRERDRATAGSTRRVALMLAAALLLTAFASYAGAALPTVPSMPASTASTAPVPAAGVGAGGLLQAGLGMLGVIALILGCAWAARRFGLQRLGGGQLVKVVSSTAVGQRERVVVVELAGQWLVLGVTPHNINALHSLPAHSSPAAPTAATATSAARLPEPLAQATQAFSQALRHSLGLKALPRTQQP